MRKTLPESKFQTRINYIQNDLDIAAKNPTKDLLDKINTQLDNLGPIISNINETLMNGRNNRADVENKMKGYRSKRNQLVNTYRDIRFQFDKNNLIKKPDQTQTGGKARIDNLFTELEEKNKNIEKDFHQTAGIVDQTKKNLLKQHQDLLNLQGQWGDAQVQLTMIDQFMGMISNRTLLTKIILILLAIFLGLADITILVLKIS